MLFLEKIQSDTLYELNYQQFREQVFNTSLINLLLGSRNANLEQSVELFRIFIYY